VNLDPIAIATRYGLPWGISAGLALALWRVMSTWKQPDVYEDVCERNNRLQDALDSMVANVKTILALMQQGRLP